MLHKGLPKDFVEYVMDAYGNGYTRVTDGKDWTTPIISGRGIRQGDPLSPCLFSLAMDFVLQAVPKEVGFSVGGELVRCLAFADDLVLVTSSVAGMRLTLTRVEAAIAKLGMELSPGKCRALSLVPAALGPGMKVVEDAAFRIGEFPLRQMQYRDHIQYLGVTFGNAGAVNADLNIQEGLMYIEKAPLKPQQRLIALRYHLLPRFVHGLVLGGFSRQSLKKFDIKVRAAVRRWLRLPRDIPLGYFHASCADGGLGVTCMSVVAPALTLGRLLKLEGSGFACARAVFRSAAVARRLREAREALECQGLEEDRWYRDARRQWWATRLYASNDGAGLRESGDCRASTFWLSGEMKTISGRDFIQYVRTHVNALPTTVRTTRGRREGRVLRCRAGCMEDETGTHAVQSCYVSHGGRVLRHDAVVETLAEALARKDYEVHHEAVLRAGGRRWKPDLIAAKDGKVTIIDAQIVNSTPGLNALHKAKCSKYSNLDLRLAVGRMCGVAVTRVGVLSCTLSWRGVWSGASAKGLKELGLSTAVMRAITLRVLKGSSVLFSRWRALLAEVGR